MVGRVEVLKGTEEGEGARAMECTARETVHIYMLSLSSAIVGERRGQRRRRHWTAVIRAGKGERPLNQIK